MAKKNMSVAAKFNEVAQKQEETKKKGKSVATKKPTKETPKTEKKPKKEAKKKLPAAELERMKTDFDPPRIDPGQTELFAAGEQATEKVEKKMGQPKKYNEPVKHISFSLPVAIIEKLKILAALQKTNQTQIILGMIKDAVAKEKDRIEAYIKLQNK